MRKRQLMAALRGSRRVARFREPSHHRAGRHLVGRADATDPRSHPLDEGTAYAGVEARTLLDIAHVITEEIGPLVTGLSALNVERCWEGAYPVTFDILRDRRIGLVVVACVDTAI
jgi:hypothetical protein